MTRSEFLTGIEARVKDPDNVLGDATKEACMQQALKEYSKERPLEQVAELIADGSSFLALPGGWEPDFSTLRRVEQMLLDVPELVSSRDYRLRRNPDGAEVLLWRRNIPPAGAICVLTYTSMHTISETESSYSSGDDEALMDLAASHAALRLAAVYLDDVDPQIGTVTLDNKSRSEKCRHLSRDLYSQYQRSMKKNRTSTGRSRFATWSSRKNRL